MTSIVLSTGLLAEVVVEDEPVCSEGKRQRDFSGKNFTDRQVGRRVHHQAFTADCGWRETLLGSGIRETLVVGGDRVSS